MPQADRTCRRPIAHDRGRVYDRPRLFAIILARRVVALLGQTGQVLEQYVWAPYGTPLIRDTSATPAPVNRVGHQGLFWHSLDGSATFNTPYPVANPTATGLYYNRNRWYAPHLGRFLQRDPNESAMLVLDTLARNGQTFHSPTLTVSFSRHFADGMNLHGYAGSNPVSSYDPQGLFLIGGTLGASALRADLMAHEGDASVSMLTAVRGIVELANTRNMMLDSVCGMAASQYSTHGIDLAIAGYQAFQTVQMALLAGGAISAGAEFAVAGFRYAIRRTRGHHGIPKYLGGLKTQIMHAVGWGHHKEFDKLLNRKLKSRGFPDRNISIHRYIDYLESTGRQEEAFEVLLDVAREYDRAHGTGFADAFLLNLLSGHYAPL